MGSGSQGDDRTLTKLGVRDLEAEGPGGAAHLLGAGCDGGVEVSGLAPDGRGLGLIQRVRCPGGFVRTCLPFVPARGSPRLHDVISDALSWNSSKLNN